MNCTRTCLDTDTHTGITGNEKSRTSLMDTDFAQVKGVPRRVAQVAGLCVCVPREHFESLKNTTCIQSTTAANLR